MGNCCRSTAKIYFAAHAEHEKMRPVVEALSMRDGEAMHLFMAWERMQGGGDSAAVGFLAFVKSLGLPPNKFLLNAFAHGCNVPRQAFPKVKEGAAMTLEQFLRCTTHLLVRNDEGLRTLAFSLYKEEDGDGISVDNANQLVHDLYQQDRGAERKIRKAEDIIRETANWDDRANKKRSSSTPFSWEEFNTLVRKNRFIVGPMYVHQSTMRKSLGGLRVWSRMKARCGEQHSGFLRDVRWQPRRQVTFGSDVGDTRDEEVGLRQRGS